MDLEGVGSYRVLYPYAALQGAGHEIVFQPQGYRKDTKELQLPVPDATGDVPSWFDADVYVCQRRLENFWPGHIRWLQSHGKKVVIELDDWYDELPFAAPALKILERRKDEISIAALNESVELADIVTVSTPKLAELYGERNPSVHVLPNFLNWVWWKDIKPVYERDRGRIRIGWMGWRQWRGRDLEILRGVIGPWLERHPECTFVNVGKDDLREYLGIPEDQYEFAPGDVFPRHSVPTSKIDIGLVPLERTTFNECKSHLKGMEYAACGIPCIASPTEPYREWVEEDVNGFLAAKPKDWFNALDAMIEGDRWRVMGAAARAKAERHTIQENWHLWDAVYSQLAPSTSSISATSSSSNAPLVSAVST